MCGDEHSTVSGDKHPPVGYEHPPVCGDEHTYAGDEHFPVGDEHRHVCGDEHKGDIRNLTFLQLYIYIDYSLKLNSQKLQLLKMKRSAQTVLHFM